jgi:hypothetical protein
LEKPAAGLAGRAAGQIESVIGEILSARILASSLCTTPMAVPWMRAPSSKQLYKN